MCISPSKAPGCRGSGGPGLSTSELCSHFQVNWVYDVVRFLSIFGKTPKFFSEQFGAHELYADSGFPIYDSSLSLC